MKTNRRYAFVLPLLLLTGLLAWGQDSSHGSNTAFATDSSSRELPTEQSAYRIHSAYMVGGGGSITRDTYLSPLRYGGWTLNLLGEKTFPLKVSDSRWMIRTGHELDFALMDNPANNAHFYSLLYNGSATALYRLGAKHLRVAWMDNLRLAFGPGLEIGLGGIYSTRNGNNPATLKLYTNAIAQASIGYYVPSEAFPLYFRLLSQINLFGIAYGNGFGESYYENFLLNNGIAGSLHFTYPGKFTRFTTLITADIPIRNFCTLRVGYRYSHLGSSLNALDTRIHSHTAFIGFVTEFYRFRGRKAMNTGRRTSLYYHD